jgi:hypothetical protein
LNPRRLSCTAEREDSGFSERNKRRQAYPQTHHNTQQACRHWGSNPRRLGCSAEEKAGFSNRNKRRQAYPQRQSEHMWHSRHAGVHRRAAHTWVALLQGWPLSTTHITPTQRGNGYIDTSCCTADMQAVGRATHTCVALLSATPQHESTYKDKCCLYHAAGMQAQCLSCSVGRCRAIINTETQCNDAYSRHAGKRQPPVPESRCWEHTTAKQHQALEHSVSRPQNPCVALLAREQPLPPPTPVLYC